MLRCLRGSRARSAARRRAASAAPCLQAEGGACKVAWSDKGTKDNATRGVCTRTEPPFMCLELEMTEVPPAP